MEKDDDDDDVDDESEQRDAERVRRGCGEKASPTSRGANINATPQTADVAPITNLNPLRRANRLARSLNPDLSEKGRNKKRNTACSDLRARCRISSCLPALCLFLLSRLPLDRTPSLPCVCAQELRCTARGYGGRGPPTRHEFSKRHSHFVRLNLEA